MPVTWRATRTLSDTPLVELVRQAKWRWHIEQDYQQLQDELGLDHFEGRSWVGWHRHVTMTLVAFGFLVLERLRGVKKGLQTTP
jgi:SRSO17 transposase